MWLTVSSAIFGLIMLAGGIGGFVTAKSVPSLVTGIVSAVLVFTGSFLSLNKPSTGFGLIAVTCVGLAGVFLKRYIDTQKPMPAMGLMGLSLLMLGLLAVGHFTSKPSN